MWPNFFIVGATRSGTTSLYEYLNKIPEVFMCPIKEPSFFSNSFNRKKPIENEQDYLQLFKNAEVNQPIGEASTRYFMDLDVPKKIKQQIPHAKIIILLRDPVERAFSSYLYYLRRENEEKFSEIIKRSLEIKIDDDFLLGLVIHGGMYFENVKRYIDTFGKENVKIIFFEDFATNTKIKFNEILEFLNIRNNQTEIFFDIHNDYKKPRNDFAKFILNVDDYMWKSNIKSIFPFLPNRKNLEGKYLESIKKPKIPEKEKQELIKIYQEDVKNLKNLLQIKLPWKNFECD